MKSASRTIKDDNGLFMRELDLELFQTVIGEQSCVVYGINLDKVELSDKIRELLKKMTGGFIPVISMKFYADWQGWDLADGESMADKTFPNEITLKLSNVHKSKPWHKIEIGPHPARPTVLSISMKSVTPFEKPPIGLFEVEKRSLVSALQKASQKIIDVAYDSTSLAFTGWAFTASEFVSVGKCWIDIETPECSTKAMSEDEVKSVELTARALAKEEKEKLAEQLICMENQQSV